jgi:hypothetical protein
MSPEERKTIDERRKYLHKMRFRYWQARSRKERSALLVEMEAVTELHRKALIPLINGKLARRLSTPPQSASFLPGGAPPGQRQ